MGKLDVKMKEFWRDNRRFADLFNSVVFQGKEVISPEELTEMDTDTSTEVRTEKKYVDTLIKARDVVRKYGLGMELVILCIENQAKVDYAEPVRIMSYDAAGYWRECNMISANNRETDRNMSTAEKFSIRKEDRIHPIITMVVYYGEEPWDGPKSLHDMFVQSSEEVLKLVPDYPINLVEIRDSDRLIFHNPDVEKVFSMVRKIYRKDIENTELLSVPMDLAETVGAIVGSERIVTLAKQQRKEHENMELCRALREMMEESEARGRREGERNGDQREVRGKIAAYHDMGLSLEQIAEKLHLSAAEVNDLFSLIDK